jgi:putative transposase
MSREAHVRFWESVEVKLPRATHFLILKEAHLRRLLHGYIGYYNTARPHQSLDNNSPQPRVVEPPPCGRIVAIPQIGGLHHRYQRVA